VNLAAVIVLGLATVRLWRIAAIDDMPWLVRARRWFVGETSMRIGNEDVHHYRRATLNHWLTCPWCCGAALALGMLILAREWPRGAFWIVGALAISEIVGLIVRNLDPTED
jgi:hypothetical protein